jgi:very-short-patch-repair endonuclease
MRLAKDLRRELSPPEVYLWRKLRALRAQGVHFRRQHPVGAYVLDFYCAEAKLAVEIDGSGHAMGRQPDHDERRDAWLCTEGITVLRIPAMEVLRDSDEVAHRIYRTAISSSPA